MQLGGAVEPRGAILIGVAQRVLSVEGRQWGTVYRVSITWMQRVAAAEDSDDSRLAQALKELDECKCALF